MNGPLVLVCGSRSWNDADAIRERLAQLPRGARIIHGGARGADRIAATVARSLGIPETAYLPDWIAEPRRAGILRNLVMLDQRPDYVIAFWDGLSTGTGHTVKAARERGIPVEVLAPVPDVKG